MKKKQEKTFAATAEINTAVHKFIFQRLRTFPSSLTKEAKNDENKNHNINKMLKRSRFFEEKNAKI